MLQDVWAKCFEPYAATLEYPRWNVFVNGAVLQRRDTTTPAVAGAGAAASTEGQSGSTMRQPEAGRRLFQELEWRRRLHPHPQEQQQQQPGQNRHQADVWGDQPASTSKAGASSPSPGFQPLDPEELRRRRRRQLLRQGTPPGAPATVNESLLWQLIANATGCHPLCYYDQYMPSEPHRKGIRPKMFTGSALANGHALMVNIHEHANGKSRTARQLAPECGRFLHVANMFHKRTPTWHRPGARNLTVWLYDRQGPQCLGCPVPAQVLRE